MPTLPIEIEDYADGEFTAVFEYDADFQREERDIGVHAGWAVSGEIVSAQIGALHLSRDMLVQAMTSDGQDGETEVRALESLAEEKALAVVNEEAEANALDLGDWAYERRRDAALDHASGWAAE